VAICAAAIIPMTLAWIGDVAAGDHLQETIARVGLGTTLGIAGGQLIGGLLTDTLGWRWAFVFLTVLFGVVGCLLAVNWRKQLRIGPPHVTAAAGRPHFVAQALTIITGSWSRVVLVTGFIEGAAGFGVLAIWPVHLHRALDLSLTASGAIVALFGVGGMLYMAVARPLIRRMGQQRLTMIGVCLLGFPAILIAFTPWWQLTLPSTLLAGFGFFMFHNTMQANATQMAPAARGTAVSLFASSMFMGQSAGVLLAAALADRFGSGQVIAVSGVLLMALGFIFARALRRREQVAVASAKLRT
jgi:YNFM family putative membrane transporter